MAFDGAPPAIWTTKPEEVDFPALLEMIVAALNASKRRCWILVDRLDAAFIDNPPLERKALRCLLIAYKDFMGHKPLRLKLFFRTDLYDTVVHDQGFRELTHVADRASPPIIWEPDKLLQMIMQRFAVNDPVCERYGFDRATIDDPDVRQAAFFSVFPGQIDVGQKKGDSWTWICNRIRDGNGVRTPRDLHGLVSKAAQKEREQLVLGNGNDAPELISAGAVKAGLSDLSGDKINTSLVAENPSLGPSIKFFTKQKAEQNSHTLEKLLGKDWANIVDQCVRIGFLEKLSDSWKVPMLYRDGLDIVQGAAFQKAKALDDE